MSEIENSGPEAIDFDAKKAQENFRAGKEKDFSKPPAEAAFGVKLLFSKEDEGFKFTPQEAIDAYNEFAIQVLEANEGWNPEEVKARILEAEKKYNHKFFGVQYSSESNRVLVSGRHRLASLRELSLTTEEENQRLNSLETDFRAVVDDIANKIPDDRTEIEVGVESILVNNMAQNYEEAKRLLLVGPKIEGFGTTEDPKIPNEKVLQFLQATFSPEGVRKAKIAKISKNDQYQIFIGEKDIQRGNELHQRNIAHWEGVVLIADDRDRYLQAAMFLEGVDDPSKVKNLYKVRATAGDHGGFHHIELRAFGVEKPGDYDYLADIDLESDEDKMRAFILGTVSHEFAHRFGFQGDQEARTQYKNIVETEASSLRRKFVSDYALRHADIYGSGEDTIMSEDFAESVRIYTTNSRYLQENYPRRFAFIEDRLPFIKPDNAVEFARAS
ncbi:MAG: hypothetical protein Q8P13_05005 [bacterium]|nr:hypothetical protein [bacterium]